ncbi:MAG: hypothetical protein HQ514_08425 [Rhodospirillales bacterium]|nr:hypothetical protein [Rhodospirillales bacterium]
MNPFRYIPRMFYSLLLFVVAPLIYDYAFAENPTAGMDCNAPQSAIEANACAAPGNLETATKNILNSLENLMESGS